MSIIENEVYIQKVLSFWRSKHLTSVMILTDDNGQKRFDIERARRHLKFVWLYDLLFKNSIDLKYYSKQTEGRIKSLEYADALIKELSIKFSREFIIEDYKTARSFMKKVFQQLLKLYGIYLNEKMLDAIFGKSIKNKKETDNIQDFSINTFFHKDLNYQFGKTVNNKGTGIFSIFFMRASGLLGLEGNDYSPISIDETMYIKNLSPLYSEPTIMRILIKACLSTQIESEEKV